MKKKLSLILLVAILACLLLSAFAGCNSNDESGGKNTDKLVIYNWEDYIEPELLDEFKAYYKSVTGINLKITYTTFDTNETMLTKLIQGDATVDLIAPSEYAIERLMTKDLLLSLTDLKQKYISQNAKYANCFDNIGNGKDGNYGTVDKNVLDTINAEFAAIKVGDNSRAMTDYMTPYMWGTLGILFNPSYISRAEVEKYGYGVLWNRGKNKNINGKILVKDSVRDTYCAAVLYMYEYGLLPEKYQSYNIQGLINCTESEMTEAAEKVLTEQREFISGYEVDFGKDDMINKTAYVDLAWSGDALWAIEEAEAVGMELDYVAPSVGANLWFDGWCIPKCSPNNLAALMFIDFMNAPENAIRNSMAIGYTCAVDKDILKATPAVTDILKSNDYDIDDYFDDERRYPDFSGEFAVMHDFGNANDAVVAMWERAKAGSGIPMTLIYVLIGVVGVFGILIAGYAIKEKVKFRKKVERI